MLKGIPILLLLIGSTAAIAQSFEWVKTFGGTGEETSWSTVLDDSGNIYTIGYFEGTADFDPGPGVYNLTSLFAHEVFIQKLDSLGDLVWAKNMGGDNSDALGMTTGVDDSGNVFLTGRFNGTGDFDPNAGISNLTAVGYSDVFIVKLDADGNLVWANRIGSSGVVYNETVRSLAIDQFGNVLIAGHFYGTIDFDPGTGVENLTSVGGPNAYILKLDSDGNYVWGKVIEATNYSTPNSITIDNSNNVYATGSFTGEVDFDPSAGTFNVTAAGNNDTFVLKLDADGNFVWAKTMGGLGYEAGHDIAVDIWDNVYTIGVFGVVEDSMDFDPGEGISNLFSAGSADVFIQKLDVDGDFQWAKNIGGIFPDAGQSIAVDLFGNVYCTGYFEGTADFDPGVETYNLTANNALGYDDVWILKLGINGSFQWAKSMGGESWDTGSSISVDGIGNVYTTGKFVDTVDFDPNIGVTNVVSAGSYDVFIQKLSPCIENTGTDVITTCDSMTWIDGITYTTSNNTATHTLTNSECCDSVVTLDLTIMSLTVDSVNNETCDGLEDGFISTSVSGGNSPFSFVWNTTDTTSSITDLSAGVYILTVTDSNGCVLTWQDTLETSLTPTISPFVGQTNTTDTIVNWNEVILVDAGNNQSSIGVVYSWQEVSGLDNVNFADPSASSTTINPQPSSATTYNLLLTATSIDGCISTGNLIITVNEEEPLDIPIDSIPPIENPIDSVPQIDFPVDSMPSLDTLVVISSFMGIPNAFTPNGDGLNDFFGPIGLESEFILEFKIYNRWGQVVFVGNETSSNWDGTFKGEEQPLAVYIYTLRYQALDQKEEFLSGAVTLIR